MPAVVSHEDLESASQERSKERAAVAKRKIPRVPRNVIPVVTTTCHSSRLEAKLSSDSAVGGSAPTVRKGRKCRVEFDEN